MKNLFSKFYTLCLIAISFAISIPAALTASTGQLATNMPIGSNASYQRHLYLEICKMYPKNKNAIGYGSLRIEQVLSNSNGTYNFNIKRNTGTDIVTERKLDPNDIFICTHLAIGIAAMDSTKPAAAVVQYYPNGTVFAAAQQTDLEALYNGFLTIKTNTLTNPEAVPMSIFRFVPETQQSATTNRSSGADVACSAFLGQMLIFRGNQSLEITIQVPTYGAIAWANVTAGTDNKIVFKPHGYLVKGAAAAVTTDQLSA